jgi:hypothetical protein
MNVQFGTGVLFMLPNAGNTAANPTPYKLAALQSVQVDFKSSLKKLYGQKQFAIAKARGTIDVNCKAKLKATDVGAINQLYFGQTTSAGKTIIADDEAGTVPAATTYTITVTNAATFVTDFGVRDASTGQQLQTVTTAPATGQYSVDPATGIYTFAAADANRKVLISYSYTSTLATATTLTLVNQLMGFAPEFRAFLYNDFRGKYFGIELFNCTMGGLSLPTKQEDFWELDIDFDACTDASDTLGKLYGDSY